MERQFKNLAFERSPYVHPRIIGSTVALRQTRSSLPSAPLCSVQLQSTNRRLVPDVTNSFPNLQSTNHRLASRFGVSLWFEWHSTLDLTLDLWRSAFPNSIGPARSQPSLLLLQLLKTSKDPGLSAAAADCAATDLPSFTIFAIIHPSKSSPSFVVVVIMIVATIFDQHVLTILGFCNLAMAS